MEIPSVQIIQIIQQFLLDSGTHYYGQPAGLEESCACLERESKVALHAVESPELFDDIKKGHWTKVLGKIVEWLEEGQIEAARSLLRQTDPMDVLRGKDSERYLALEALVRKSQFDSALTLHKAEKRASIALGLQEHVRTVAPKRLVKLLGQAMKWQVSQKLIDPDTPYDLFLDQVPSVVPQDDQPVLNCSKEIKFPKNAHAEAIAFSPDGLSLCCGTADGFIEVYNYLTGKLRMDLAYQAKDQTMVVESAVLSLDVSKDSLRLAAGTQNGSISIFSLVTGQCEQTIGSAHSQGIAGITFSSDSTQVLSASFDQTIRQAVHGLKSGKCLKAFRGHSSYVNQASYSSNETRVLSGSSDGTVKIWNASTTDCLLTVCLANGKPQAVAGTLSSVHTVVPLPGSAEVFVVANQSRYLYLLTGSGKVADGS
ncbi:Serine/threonine-protein kinase smu1 [Kappamyces sp. JEL0680]|nr:Serine/threonine-protein kinase smu1 [Kappamyces sp. JEL0680]